MLALGLSGRAIKKFHTNLGIQPGLWSLHFEMMCSWQLLRDWMSGYLSLGDYQYAQVEPDPYKGGYLRFLRVRNFRHSSLDTFLCLPGIWLL